MVQVLIVAKTKMQTGICLGGLVLDDCRSVRLLPSQGHNHPKGERIDKLVHVGEVWDLTLKEMPNREIRPPHTEDIRVSRGRRIQKIPNLRDFLLERVHAPFVHPEALFDRLIRFTQNRRGFVSPAGGLPPYSTGFWRFEKTLRKHRVDGKTRYIYPDDDANWTLDVPYVGFQKPPDNIPAGILLRFSLARGFRNDPQKRCYLQLSGWFL